MKCKETEVEMKNKKLREGLLPKHQSYATARTKRKIERRSIREKINSSDDPYIAMDTLMTKVALRKQP